MSASTTPLSHDRMEEMLADYAFNHLPEAEARHFEESLPLYPDIRAEVEQVRAVFAQFDKDDFMERKTRPARTLSVHVQERLARPRRFSLLSGRTMRHIWPAVGLVILLVVLFSPGGFLSHYVGTGGTQQPGQVQIAGVIPEPQPLVTQEEMTQILTSAAGDTVDPAEVALVLPDITPLLNDKTLVADEAFSASDIMSDDMVQSLAENFLYPMSDYVLSGGLYEGLNESEVQQLFEELEHNDIL